jgi:hypothetical protein
MDALRFELGAAFSRCEGDARQATAPSRYTPASRSALDGARKMLVVLGMKRSVCYALLVSITAASPVLAQTSATPGAATPNGIVTLGTSTSGSAASPTTNATTQPASATTTTGGSATASAGSASATQSSSLGTAGSTSSPRATSGGSSGTALTAPSSGAPAWVLCPPSGASGLQPFLTGTDLSCAP